MLHEIVDPVHLLQYNRFVSAQVANIFKLQATCVSKHVGKCTFVNICFPFSYDCQPR